MLKHNELGLCKTLDVDQPINDIDLDWLSGGIRVLPSTDEMIHVMQYANKHYSERKLMQTGINGDRLCITDGRKRRGFIGLNIGRTLLELHIPRRVLTSLQVKSTGGQMEIHEILASRCQCKIISGSIAISGKMEELEVYAAASQIVGRHLKADTLMLHSNSSKVKISGEFRHVESKSTGRGLYMDCLRIPDYLGSISTGMKAVVSIPDHEGFEVHLQERAGTLKSDFELTPLHGKLGCFSYKNGKKQFHIEIRGGSFHLKAKQRDSPSILREARKWQAGL